MNLNAKGELMTKAVSIAVPYLRAWRIERGLTQGQLADKAGVGRSSITNTENGGKVSPLTISRLAKALGITQAQLLDEDPAHRKSPSTP